MVRGGTAKGQTLKPVFGKTPKGGRRSILKVHGNIIDDLRAAIASAERLRGYPVHQDTLQFWRELLTQARAEKRHANPADVETLDRRIGELQRSEEHTSELQSIMRI